MLKRLLSFLLILTFLVPASVLGSTVHPCGMMDDGSAEIMDMMSCCAQVFRQAREDGSAQLSHRCDVRPGAVERQPAATTFKTQNEVPCPAECPLESITVHISPEFHSQFPAGALDLPFAGSFEPVFLRNCSFLI